MSVPETFFHVGYARAASTFLQKTVFPALMGIQYIPRNNFRVRESEKKRFKDSKVLMSREAGEYIFDRCEKVHEIFDSTIIISLRRHDALAASTYRLNVKNGHTYRFPEFLDIKNNQGVRKLEDFTYMRLIEYVEKITGKRPLVLIFEDYKNDPDFYLDTLCAGLTCEIDRSKISQKAVHKSYTDKQLRLRRQFSQKFLDPSLDKENLVNTSIQDYRLLKSIKERVLIRVSGLFMRLARFAPQSWLDSEPLIFQEDLESIRDYFADDWRACIAYVDEQSERLGVIRNVAKQR
ncbi:hypothetical protein NBRC116583_14190 [Arenicella sp. 4NH20-0111]